MTAEEAGQLGSGFGPERGGHAEVRDETLAFLRGIPPFSNPQQIGWVDCHEDVKIAPGVDRSAAVSRDLGRASEQCSCRRSPERDDDVGPNLFEFGSEPPGAALDLARIGLRMDSPLSPLLIFEVFDGVGDIAFAPIYPRLFQALGEENARGSDKRVSLDVLAIAGLLAYEEEPGIPGPLAKDELCGIFIKLAALASLRLLADCEQRRPTCMFAGESWAEFHCLRPVPVSPRLLTAETSCVATKMPGALSVVSSGTHPADQITWPSVPGTLCSASERFSLN